LLSELSPRLEEYLIRLYVRKPFDPKELEALLERHAADDAQRDRVARSVRLFNTIVPTGTHLKFGWPDALAEAGQVGVPALMAAVGDKSYPSFIRHDGAWALGLIGDPRAIETLTAVAEDEATPAKYRDIAREFVRVLKEKAAQAAPRIEAAGKVDSAKEAAAPLPDLRLTGGEVTPEAISKLAARHWGTVTLAEAHLTGEIVERLRQAGSIRQLRLFGTGLSGQIPRLEHVTGLTGLENRRSAQRS
jgi:HEAT repeat protein